MVLFNYSTKEITAKVVYYGPGLCGKTTNLQFIYESLPENKRGRMLSLSTQTDRTLYFDFLPMELGDIRGMKTRIQLYTVPGQVFYNETRKMVLKGVDGVVFVADSQTQMADANLESFRNLLENLEEHGLDPVSIPLVLQFNKRDLPSILSVEEMNAALNRFNSPFYEAIATTGIGVHDTLKAVSKLVLRALSGKYPGSEATDDLPIADAIAPPPPAPVPAEPAPEAPPPRATAAPPAASNEIGWGEDALEEQLDQMDAAEIEGLLEEVAEYDVAPEVDTPAAVSPVPGATAPSRTASDPLGNLAAEEFSFGDLDVEGIEAAVPEPISRSDPAATAADRPTEPAAAPPGGPPDRRIDPAPDAPLFDSSVSPPPAPALSLESFLENPDPPAESNTMSPAPASIESVPVLSDGEEICLPVRLNVNGEERCFTLTLRLAPEDGDPVTA